MRFRERRGSPALLRGFNQISVTKLKQGPHADPAPGIAHETGPAAHP